jgi:drug/metabolite transporter (DMT)-like permease
VISINRTQWPYIRLHRDRISESGIGRVSLTISVICGSTFNGFAKNLESALSAMSLVFVSEILNFFFILFSFGFVPMVKRILALSRSDLFPLICIGCLSGIVAPLLWFTGLGMTTAVNAGLFGKAEVIFLLLMAHLVLGEKVEKAHFVALLVILAGILFVTLRGFSEGIRLQTGDLVIILATLCYGSSNIIYRKFVPHLEPFLPLFTRCVCALTAFFLLSSFTTLSTIDEVLVFPMELVPPLIGFAFISRFLNSILYYQAIEYVPMSTVSLFSTIDVVGSMAFAALYLGESIEWYHFVGGALVLLGNILLTYFKRMGHEHHAQQSIHPHMNPGS